MTALTTSYLSPPQYAKRLGIDPVKILGWIKKGELRAINIASNLTGRPRYRIPIDAILEFEALRSARPAVKVVRRKKKKQDSDFVTYF
jgi:predicted site-specific integrase-resolvase